MRHNSMFSSSVRSATRFTSRFGQIRTYTRHSRTQVDKGKRKISCMKH
ncbi:hypothetical protein MtrunA17_Chr3g0108721 [Medicago truncatula]|uniref:Uncharacterized protein n=1 Tax=Medicago truncatula TaxID=3880 RepID=A0A396IRK5_MEDTR|nr:hypothetical protein MtrunA17_Chr3g0108721 [Medicago truncatula]